MKPTIKFAAAEADKPSSSTDSAHAASRSRASSLPAMTQAPPSRDQSSWYKAMNVQAQFMQPIFTADEVAKASLLPTQQQQEQIRSHLLAASRAIDAKTHAEDRLPPMAANQAHAENILGAEWLLTSWKVIMVQSKQPAGKVSASKAPAGKAPAGKEPASKAPAEDEDGHWLKAGVLAALYQHRLQQVCPPYKRISGLNYAKTGHKTNVADGWVYRNADTARMTVVGQNAMSFYASGACKLSDVLTHESVHEVQIGESLAEFKLKSKWASHPSPLHADSISRSHPRAGFLDIAQTMPRFNRDIIDPECEEISNQFKLLSIPMEIQARLEAYAVEPWLEACQVEQIGTMTRIKHDQVVKIGKSIVACLKNIVPEPLPPSDIPLIHEVPVDFQFLWRDERLSTEDADSTHGVELKQLGLILQALGSISRASASVGWDRERHRKQFDEVVQTVVSREGQAPVTLKFIADALRGFNAELLGEGVRMDGLIMTLSDLSLIEPAGPKSKTDPLMRLAANLTASGYAASTPAALQAEMTQLMQKAKFVEAVQWFRTPAADADLPFAHAVLQGAIHRLAAQLLGVNPSDFPPPALHVFEASPTLDFVEKFTVTPHQKRTASWSVIPWQLNVPAHLLRDPERVAARLAKWAFDIAGDAYYHAQYTNPKVKYGVVGELQNMSGSICLLNPFVKHAFVGGFRNMQSVHKSFVPIAYKPLWSDNARAMVWHDSRRGKVKAQMNDSTQTQQARKDAKKVYDDSVHLRFALPYIAARRALGEAARQAVGG